MKNKIKFFLAIKEKIVIMDKFLKLKNLFETDAYNAISQSQEIILQATHFSSKNDFASYFKDHAQTSTCQTEYVSFSLGIKCMDCSLDSTSLLCLDCFFNGNHDGHKYAVDPDSYGSCDCGDSSQLKPSGFCKFHKGLLDDENPKNDLGEELTNLLTDVIFKAAFSSLSKFTNNNVQFASVILNFLSSFLEFGEIFRRLLSISLTEKTDFKNLMQNITEYSGEFNEELQKFCGKLVNDHVFMKNFSTITFDLILAKILNKQIEEFSHQGSNENIQCWNYFWFHFFSKRSLHFNILHKKWDWVSFIISCSKQLKKHFIMKVSGYNLLESPDYVDYVCAFPSASQIQPNEETQRLFDRFFNEILCCGFESTERNDTIIPISFTDKKDMHFMSIFIFNTNFYSFFNCFKSKKNLKFDSLFSQLEKLTDIRSIYKVNFNDSENDRFIHKFFNDDTILNEDVTFPSYYYNSLHDGGSFFYSMPLYDSLVVLCGLENSCKIKIARFLSLPSYQKLRVKLGIITLKKLLSFVAFQLGLVRLCNHQLVDVYYTLCNNPNYASFSFPLYLPLFQLLIGLKCNDEEFSMKEFFAFEMAREIGLFDDYSSQSYQNEDINEKRSDMIFAFLYFSIVLVVERRLFNYDNIKFLEEQLIFSIKNGCTDYSKLLSQCDERVADRKVNPLLFNDAFTNVATFLKRNPIQKNDHLSFKLKEDVKWNPFSGIISFALSKGLLNNEISKNPDNFIEVQEFEPEETYFFNMPNYSPFSFSTTSYGLNYSIHDNDNDPVNYEGLSIKLKEFLFTPTVLAVTYHALRINSPNIGLNDHIALNILILISKFLKGDDHKTQKKFDDTIVIQYNSISDFISQIRTVLFNYSIDKNNDAKIENTLNIDNFKCLLKMKISYDKLEPKSLIDLLQEKGQIGKKVLNILSESSVIDGFDNNKLNEAGIAEKKKAQKERITKMKSNIIDHFNNMISNYNSSNSELNEPANSQENNELNEVCSICSSQKKDEALSYPIYIYRTKLPFIFDKPPEVKKGEKIDHLIPVSCDADIDLQLDDDIFLLAGLEEEEEEEYFETALQRRQAMLADLRKKQKARLEKRRQKQEEEEEEEGMPKRISAGANFVIQFGICQHHLHPSCVNSKEFICPMDRTTKNGFLPCLSDLPKASFSFEDNGKESQSNLNGLSEKVKNSINVFLDVFKSSIVSGQLDRPCDIFTELVKSISGLIVTYEVRLRSLPGCLDSNRAKILARNLFLAAWLGYRIHGKPKMEDRKPYIEKKDDEDFECAEFKMTEFQKFIKKLIECDDIETNSSSFKRIVSSFMKEESKEFYLFLRRVCLSDFFLLGNSVNTEEEENMPHNLIRNFVDWDEVLSVRNLSLRYNAKFENFEEEEFKLKPFIFKSLPSEFLRLAIKPFKLPLNETTKMKVYNLLNYNDLIENYNDFDNDDSRPIDEVKEREEVSTSLFIHSRKNYPSVLLCIGSNASKVIVVYRNKYSILNPFYLDKYGFSDIGFFRSQPLFLNQELYERVIDDLLSGNFTNYLVYPI